MKKSYSIEFKNSAIKEFKKLPREIQVRLKNKIDELGDNPFPSGAKRLIGMGDYYRIRVGDYRIIYSVLKSENRLQIARVRHRKTAYKD